MGTIKTTNIQSITGSGTVTIGQSGETIDIPSGVTFDSTGATVTGALTNTPAFYAYLGSNQSGLTDDANVKITIDTEVIDTDNCFASNKFTPTTAGKYLLYASINYDSLAASNLRACDTRIYKNGSAIAKNTFNFIDNYAKNSAQHLSVVVDANGSSDYFELYGQANTQNSGTWTATGYSNSEIRTYFGGYKIIGA